MHGVEKGAAPRCARVDVPAELHEAPYANAGGGDSGGSNSERE